MGAIYDKGFPDRSLGILTYTAVYSRSHILIRDCIVTINHVLINIQCYIYVLDGDFFFLSLYVYGVLRTDVKYVHMYMGLMPGYILYIALNAVSR